MLGFRRLNEKSVTKAVRKMLKEEAYGVLNPTDPRDERLRHPSSAGRSNDYDGEIVPAPVLDLAGMVWVRLKAERVDILRGTYQDFRVAVLRGTTPVFTGLILVTAVVLSSVGVVVLQGSLGWQVSAGVLGACVVLFALDRYVRWRRHKARFISERLSERARDFLRGGRVTFDQFEFVVRTRLSEIINEQIAEGHMIVRCAAMIPETALEVISPVASVVEIRRRVRSRASGVIGVSGSRGAGKSMAVNDLRRFEPEIGQMVWLRMPAPEASKDLAKYVLRAVAESIAGAVQPAKHRRREAWGFWLLIAGTILMTVGSLLELVGQRYAETPTGMRGPVMTALALLGQGLLDHQLEVYGLTAALVGALVILMGAGFAIGALERRMGHVRAMAADIRSRLQFEETLGFQGSGALAIGRTNVGLGRTRSIREREWDVGDVYLAFERLVECYRRATDRRVVLLIDELDRYGEGETGSEELHRALNQIKPFFEVTGVCAVMTVSDQARRDFGLEDHESRSVLTPRSRR